MTSTAEPPVAQGFLGVEFRVCTKGEEKLEATFTGATCEADADAWLLRHVQVRSWNDWTIGIRIRLENGGEVDFPHMVWTGHTGGTVREAAVAYLEKLATDPLYHEEIRTDAVWLAERIKGARLRLPSVKARCRL